MTSSYFTARPAVSSDAASIAHVHHTSWQESYAHHPELLASRTLAQRQAQWSQSLTHGFPQPGTICFVADSPSGIIGFILHGPNQHATEVYSLYVLDAHHGTGAAQALMRTIETEGPRTVWLLEDNLRAMAFYQKMGYELVEGRDGSQVDPRNGLVVVKMVSL
ncbi:acyl-CoA N-acyltransferase [Cutaneotrichosporon oleaginosum]|uniref:Acyl-CoA N-acyltransferase n=1 Tax=Cutaneotrichosporon oleaginosum TaxID=879819 RepID=A0A0J0XI29_9TREE|nr:acyl-CoA N-acyltransferase [Cutaneotrichosporon oleaginosum]KLT40785.1 acyl-CoA N-acyltransferase [Cutaneotrichosporon oleaginosum]TXT11903.1 hypothetical protein COLE_02313 [Cutaneotrichosporon oleaginosum]